MRKVVPAVPEQSAHQQDQPEGQPAQTGQKESAHQSHQSAPLTSHADMEWALEFGCP